MLVHDDEEFQCHFAQFISLAFWLWWWPRESTSRGWHSGVSVMILRCTEQIASRKHRWVENHICWKCLAWVCRKSKTHPNLYHSNDFQKLHVPNNLAMISLPVKNNKQLQRPKDLAQFINTVRACEDKQRCILSNDVIHGTVMVQSWYVDRSLKVHQRCARSTPRVR